MTTGTFDRLSFANTVGYTMAADITFPYTTYWSLLTDNSGTKTALGNTSLLGNLTVGVTSASAQTGFFELGTFNITIAGATSLTHTLSKTGAGSVLFTGLISWINSVGRIDFATGNPTVECRGGITCVNTQDNANYGSGTGTAGVVGYVSSTSHFKSGTGTWTFSTNNQSIAGSGRLVWSCPVVISGAIVLTVGSGFTYTLSGSNTENLSTGFIFNNTVNGTVSGSTLRLAGFVGFSNSTAPMLTGVLDTTTSANTVGYLYDGSYTLPLTTYSSLYVGGAGTKTLTGNTTLTGALTIGGILGASKSILDTAAFNLTVATTTFIGDNASQQQGLLQASGAGSLLFTGLMTIGNGMNAAIDFSGNPSVELRGGITQINPLSTTINSGTGTWTFSTNNQSLAINTSSSVAGWIIAAPIMISGAITLTMSQGSSGTSATTFTGVLNGNNAASTFDNRTVLNYQNATRPMVTGVLQTNAAANTFLYNGATNQDVKGGASTGAKQIYRTLTFAGGSFTKTLQGYVSVINTFTITAPATKVDNGFTLTNP
jgi:hypothetical protein